MQWQDPLQCRVVVLDVRLTLRFWDRGQSRNAPVSGEGAGFEDEIEGVGDAVEECGSVGQAGVLDELHGDVIKPRRLPEGAFMEDDLWVVYGG